MSNEKLSRVPELIVEALKKPLPPESIAPHPTKPYLSTIKAIYIIERFNEVFGLGRWYINNEVVKQEGKMVVVKSTFICEQYGIQIPDIFGGNDNPDLGDAYKGACTDALSKIGSYLYVGMDVYKGKHDNKSVKQTEQSQNSTPHPTLSTTEDNRPWLSENEYNLFLKDINNGNFTNYLDAKNKFRMKRIYRETLDKAVEFSKQLLK